MAVLKISVEALNALEQEISAISRDSQQTNARLRSAVETLASSWEGKEVNIIIDKLIETCSADDQKIRLLDSLVQLMEMTRTAYTETDSSLAESIRGLFK